MAPVLLPLQCYGFVTFANGADAEGVLTFAQQQGIWAEERMLRVNYAQGNMPEWKVGRRHLVPQDWFQNCRQPCSKVAGC
jgi:hypothetical protein